MWEVVLPAALPLIIAGMRVGIGLAFLNLVAAEMSGASAGLGYRVSASHLAFRADKMIAALVALGVLGAASDGAFRGVVFVKFCKNGQDISALIWAALHRAGNSSRIARQRFRVVPHEFSL